jgi:thioredoxin reductase (NADPH)
MVHRGGALRAEVILQNRLFSRENIDIRWNSKVDAFLGYNKLERIRLASDGKFSEIKSEAAFVAIGHVPETQFLKDWIDVDVDGYIVVAPGSTSTSRSGVFAAGDVMDRHYRQAITSAGTGCMAALDADRWLSENHVHSDSARDASADAVLQGFRR